MPLNSPFMSLTFSRYVRFVFHVCPVLSLRVISLSPVVPIGFLVLCFPSFPLRCPCFHFCPLHVPFSSPLFPFHFPLLSCHVGFLFPPLISLHFLAFPLCFPIFPANKHGFSSVFVIRTSKSTEFSGFSAKGGRNPKPAKSRQGESSLGPLFCDNGSPKTTISSLRRPHAEQCRRICIYIDVLRREIYTYTKL